MKNFCYTREIIKLTARIKMKKLQIVLSILTLSGLMTASLAGVSVVALDGPAGVSAGLALQNATERSQTNDIIFGETNEFDEVFKITYVRSGTRAMEVWTRSGAKNRSIRRLWVVGYDYERGVTEAEADAKFEGLGVEDTTSWATEVAYYETDNPDWQRELVTKEGKPLTEDNKTDVLYFAAEFGDYEWTDDGLVWSNLSWRRGKMDYRNCVHGEQYTNVSYCKPVAGTDGKVEFWPYGRVHALTKPVITWDEEWRGIQSERIERLEKEVGSLVDLFEVDQGKGKQELEEKSTSLLGELVKLKKTLAALNDTPERGELILRRDKLEETLDGLFNRNGNNGEEENGNIQGSGSIMTGISGMDEGQQGVNGRLLSSNSDKNVAQGNIASINWDKINSQDSDAEEDAALAGDAKGDTEIRTDEAREAEVPNLGEEKGSGFNIWTVLLPLIAGVVTFVWLWAKRVLMRDEN